MKDERGLEISDKKAWWIIGIMAFVFMIPHSMAPWGNGNYPTDVCVYSRCAMWMSDGLVMYRDMFDHKGPLVYLVYQLFTSIAGLQGVWLFDILIAGVMMGLFYRIGRLYNDEKSSLVISLLMGMYMQLPFVDGGGPEWIAAPWCAYCCYVMAKHLKDGGYFSFAEMGMLAMSVGVCLMTKANTSAGIIPIAAYALYHLIRYWNGRVFLRYAGAVTAGLGVVFVPIAWWLYKEGNFNEFIDCYLRFNLHGYGEQTGYSQLTGARDITLASIPGYIFFAAFLTFRHQDKRTVFWVSMVFLFSIVLNAYIKNGYQHYIFPCFGIFALLLSMSWEGIRKSRPWHVIVVFVCALIGVVTYGVRVYLRAFPFDKSHDTEVSSFLNSESGENGYIMIYPFMDRTMYIVTDPEYCYTYRLWLLANGKPASRYFYSPPGMTEEMYQESWQEITEHAPRWIVAHEQNSEDILRLGYEIYKQEPSGYQILKMKNEK